MSYILEALKKSEYARQQGKVPDLATPPPVDAPGSAASDANQFPLLAASALLVAIAMAVTGWWSPWQTPSKSMTADPMPAQPAASLETAVVASTAPPPTPAAALPGAKPPAVPLEQPKPVVQAQTLPPAPKVVLPARPLPPAAPATATASPPASAPTSIALPTPPSRVLDFYELPPVVRERIPALAISGFSYAEEPGMRMAVINDRVLRQGDSAAPGITLERIASDGVVLNFSGYRFRPQR